MSANTYIPTHEAVLADPPEISVAASSNLLSRLRWRRGDTIFAAINGFVTAAWLHAFPFVKSFNLLDIAFDSLVLSVAVVALLYIRTFRYGTLEWAWRLLIFSHLICLLDCFTAEPPAASTAIAIATYLSETATIIAILLGFHHYHQGREKQSQNLRRVKLKRYQTERRYAELVNAVEGVVWEVDPETLRFLFVSKQAERLLGYPLSQWYDEPNFWANHIHPEDRDWTVQFCLQESRVHRPHQFEYRMIAADGRIVWLRDLVNSVRYPDGSWRLCGVMFVITETKELEERLRHGAAHDSLTGLPNRETFLERLREVHAKDPENPRYAVLFLDIDRFKIVNDTLGHHHGDRLVVALAKRLSRLMEGRGTVGRLGGDEFAVLAEQTADGADAFKFASNLQSVISRPIRIGGRVLEPTVSVGIALGRRDCADVQELLQDADTAMYQAKSSQRGSFQIFDLEMRRALLDHVKLEADLKRGFRAGEFRVFFQPIVDLQTGRAEAFEALTRWLHPERGVVEAGQFMKVALESDIGAELAWNAIDQTFAQAKQWAPLYPARGLSLNVSERQFAQPDFLGRMERSLALSGADASNLVLEITEDVATEDSVTELKLCELKRMGFGLALDDFGVGRSSLNRLCRLPIDMIKVDRSFVRSMDLDESEVLIRAILTVARDLGMEVVAEGIETEAQRSRLLEMGFRFGQGYLFDRALPFEQAELRLAHGYPAARVMEEDPRLAHLAYQ